MMRPLEISNIDQHVRSAEVRQEYDIVMREAIRRDIANHHGDLSPMELFRYKLLSPDPETREYCHETLIQKIMDGGLSLREELEYNAIAPPGENMMELRQKGWAYI